MERKIGCLRYYVMQVRPRSASLKHSRDPRFAETVAQGCTNANITLRGYIQAQDLRVSSAAGPDGHTQALVSALVLLLTPLVAVAAAERSLVIVCLRTPEFVAKCHDSS